MKLASVDLNVQSFGREIKRFLSIIDRKHWERQIEKIKASEGIFFKNYYLLKRNPLLEGIEQYNLLNNQGKSIWKHRSPEIDFLARNAFIINRVVHSANASVKKQILGKLSCDDIRPILHELSIAISFLSNGFEVEFSEYEGNTRYDFNVVRDSIEAEVECKWKSVDAGRKIKRGAFYSLCDEILKQCGKYKIKCVIKIQCKRSIVKNRDALISIVEKLTSGIRNRAEEIDLNQDLSVTINYLPKELEIKSDQDFRSAIEPFLAPNSHLGILSNNGTTIGIVVESEDKDKVLASIYKELKQSLDQFSKTRPGLLSCNIEGIYPEEWEALQGENGLTTMTSRLLNKNEAVHLHTISYLSEAEVTKEVNSTDYTFPTLFFKNQNCLFHKGEDIFSLKK